MRLRRKEGRRDCKEMQIGEEEDREEERRKERDQREDQMREIGGENGERRREREGEEREEEEKRNIDAKSSGTGERAFPGRACVCVWLPANRCGRSMVNGGAIDARSAETLRDRRSTARHSGERFISAPT